MPFKNAPRLKLVPALSDNITDAGSWILLAALWAFTCFTYSSLPDIIPVHFDDTGKADGFGNKANVYILPAIATVLCLLLTIVNRFPHLFNYLTPITPGNALRQYTKATRLLRYLKLACMIIFNIGVWATVQATFDGTNKLSAWFLPLILVITLAPVLLFVIRSFRIQQQ